MPAIVTCSRRVSSAPVSTLFSAAFDCATGRRRLVVSCGARGDRAPRALGHQGEGEDVPECVGAAVVGTEEGRASRVQADEFSAPHALVRFFFLLIGAPPLSTLSPGPTISR